MTERVNKNKIQRVTGFVTALLFSFILSSTAHAQMQFFSGGSTAGDIDQDGSGNIIFDIGGSEKARLDTNGRLEAQEGAQPGYDTTCASVADAGTIRLNSGGATTDGLVGYWNLNDTSGTTVKGIIGGDGTYSGETDIPSQTGKIANAIKFDGVDDGISIPNISSHENFTAFTVSAWVYPYSSGQTAGGRIVSKADGGTGDNFCLYLITTEYNVNFRLETDGDVQANLAATDGDVPQDTWTHVTATWDGTNMRLYIDGTEDGNSPTAKSGTIDADGNPLVIGTHSGDPTNRRFNGKIDEVRLYNRALSASEISDLHAFTGPTIDYCDGSSWNTIGAQ